MRLADASFRRRCGSVIIQGVKRVYRGSKAQENAGGGFAGFFGTVVQPFLCQENAGRNKQAECGQTHQRHYKV